MIYSMINSTGLREQGKGRILSKEPELSTQLMPEQPGLLSLWPQALTVSTQWGQLSSSLNRIREGIDAGQEGGEKIQSG